MLSMIYSNKGDINSVRSMNFIERNNDVELIIIDSLWNEETKKKLVDLAHYFKKVVYAPPKERKQDKRYDFLSCHNTGLAYSEEDWCMASGGRNEMKPDFFERLRETISNFGGGASMKLLDESTWMAGGGRLKQEFVEHLKNLDALFGYKIAIRPVELEANMLDTKWNYSNRFTQRYIFMSSVPVGNKDERGWNPIVTCGFVVMPRKTWYAINGFNEQYDVGCYWWDNELYYLFINNNIRLILDQQLMIFRHPHVSACLPENPECYQIYRENILKTPKVSPNDFNLEELHKEFMEKKQQYIL